MRAADGIGNSFLRELGDSDLDKDAFDAFSRCGQFISFDEEVNGR